MIIPRHSLNLNLATLKSPNPSHFIKFAPTRDHILCNQIWKEAFSPCKDSGNAPNIPNSWNLMSLYCEAKTRCEPERLHLHRQRTNGQQELVKPVYSDHKLVTCRNTTHTDHWREMRAPSAASARGGSPSWPHSTKGHGQTRQLPLQSRTQQNPTQSSAGKHQPPPREPHTQRERRQFMWVYL